MGDQIFGSQSHLFEQAPKDDIRRATLIYENPMHLEPIDHGDNHKRLILAYFPYRVYVGT
jgi:hypothetical protein